MGEGGGGKGLLYTAAVFFLSVKSYNSRAKVQLTHFTVWLYASPLDVQLLIFSTVLNNESCWINHSTKRPFSEDFYENPQSLWLCWGLNQDPQRHTSPARQQPESSPQPLISNHSQNKWFSSMCVPINIPIRRFFNVAPGSELRGSNLSCACNTAQWRGFPRHNCLLCWGVSRAERTGAPPSTSRGWEVRYQVGYLPTPKKPFLKSLFLICISYEAKTKAPLWHLGSN